MKFSAAEPFRPLIEYFLHEGIYIDWRSGKNVFRLVDQGATVELEHLAAESLLLLLAAENGHLRLDSDALWMVGS